MKYFSEIFNVIARQRQGATYQALAAPRKLNPLLSTINLSSCPLALLSVEEATAAAVRLLKKDERSKIKCQGTSLGIIMY